jgi:hypothetical protein
VQLRKHCDFELLVLGIHIEFDEIAELFDLHAHFVCKIPQGEKREDARRRLMSAFSRPHTPDAVIRSPQAVVRYLSRTFRLRDVATWPISALKAAWKLVDQKFHYTRTGGAFAEWRRLRKSEIGQLELEQLRRKRKNEALKPIRSWSQESGTSAANKFAERCTEKRASPINGRRPPRNGRRTCSPGRRTITNLLQLWTHPKQTHNCRRRRRSPPPFCQSPLREPLYLRQT